MDIADNQRPTVTILDDEEIIRRAFKKRLEGSGYIVHTARDFLEFTQIMQECDAVLCDIIIPGGSGLQALKWTRDHFPSTPVILMTGQPTYETAAEAIRLGAFDYLTKPVSRDDLLLTLERAINNRQLMKEKQRLEVENESYRLKLEEKVVQQTRALSDSQDFLATLTNTMADVVFSLNMPGFQIKYVNQAVADIFGYQPQEMLGQPFSCLFIDDSSFAVFNQKQIMAIASGNSQMRIEQPMLKKDGSTITAEVLSTFVIKEDNHLAEMISVVRDVTQRSFLFGVVAHELRSPLSLMTGFLQVLLTDMDKMDRASLAKYLDIVNKQSLRMLHMLDEFLDVTKIEFGEVTLNLEQVNLVDLVREYIGDFSYLAAKKNITLKEQFISPSLACMCDSHKIGEVVANFVDNAIKYSPPGTVVQLIARQENGQVWFGVKDRGVGIKSEELQFLFKGFSHKRISTKPTGGELSTGLGLAICKRIVEAHQGEIGVESTLGEGSIFWFSLPASDTPKK